MGEIGTRVNPSEHQIALTSKLKTMG